MLLTTPLIHAARERWPEATIDVLGFGGTLGMLRGNPDVAALIEVPAGSGWWASRRLIARLWRRYDLALIAQYSDRAHLYGFAAARRRAGQVTDDAQVGLEAGAARAPGADEQRPVALGDPEAAPARALGRAARRAPGRAGRDAAAGGDRRRAEAAVRGAAGACRGRLQARGRSRTGACSSRRCSSAACRSFSPARRRPATRRWSSRCASGFDADRVVDGAGRLDLNQVATLLRGAALYVGGDTSITHLAAACEIPVVALYGPINPRYFGPWPPSPTLEVPYVAHALVQRAGSVSVLQGTPACVPCDRAGCEDRNDSASVCLQTMAPARVVAEVDRILASGRAAERQ